MDTAKSNFARSAWSCLRVLMATLLLSLASGAALAAITVTAVTVNGGATTNAAPNTNMTVTVTVELTRGTKWHSTSFTTSPASSLSWCYFAPTINGNGTYTRSFTVEAPSAVGTFSLITQAHAGSECSGTTSAAYTLPDAIYTGPMPAALDHVRILHDGSALTCGVEPVSLQACADAACSTLYTGSVSVALGTAAGTWSANPVTFINGNGSVNLSNASAGSVTLAGTVNSPAATNSAAVCKKGSTVGDCALVFTNASCSLDAVEAGQAPNTAILTKRIGGAVTLDVLALNSGVLNTSSTATIAATLVEANASGCTSTALSPTVTFTMTGANAGRRPVTFSPSAAARNVRVRMVSGSLVGCSSDNFVIRPDSLALTVSNINAYAAGTDAGAGTGLAAGSANFTMAAAASAGYDGAPLVNPNRVNSSSLKAGLVAGAFTPASAGTAWTASGSAFTYSEVGYFRLLPYAVYDETFADIDESKSPKECFNDANFANAGTIADPNTPIGGLLGCYFGSGATSNYFGRFVPARLVLSGTSLANRSAVTGCAVEPDFSYMGEPMEQTLTLTAQNAAGVTTENYEGPFARLNLATQLGLGAIDAPAAGTRTPFPVCGASPAHPCVTPGAISGAFDKGVAVLALPLTVLRGAAPAGPFDSFRIGVAPVDSDLVKLAAYDLDTTNAGSVNHALAGSTQVRYGRMLVDNAYGSELLNLSIKLSAQFWNRTGYATNTLDNCTVPVFGNFVVTSYLGGLNPGNMPDASRGAAAMLVNGVSKMVLAKPSPAPAIKGSVTLRSNLDYLPGNGRATFGVYKAGPVIYVRETY